MTANPDHQSGDAPRPKLAPSAGAPDVDEAPSVEVRALQQLDLLLELTAAEDLNEVLGICLDAAIDSSGMDCGGIYLVDPESGELVLARHRGLPAEHIAAVTRFPADSQQGRLVAAKLPLFGSYAGLLGPTRPLSGSLRAFGMIPIVYRNRPVACLNIASHNAERMPDTAHDLLARMTGLVAGSIGRAIAEQALRESERRHRELADSLPQGVFEAAADATLLFLNRKACAMFGFSQADLGRNHTIFELIAEEDRARFRTSLARVFAGQELGETEYACQRRDRQRFPVELSASPVLREGYPSGVRGIVVDISARKQAEAERASLQDQLRQSQKMESIGRLAGGIAHDFNNLLTGILGLADMSLGSVSSADPLASDLLELKKAAERATRLTSQLLAFSRKQIIDPKIIDLNALLENASAMLKRMVGENIDFRFMPGSHLWPVKVDPGQVEQVLTNVVINARDAMSEGGRLVVETVNMTLDEDYTALHPDTAPGDYVMLGVSDTGCGMGPEILKHLFEPFFTTKALGQGTGLGLSMVYGIVKQNGGIVSVYSEVGAGTTFRVYWPRVLAPAELPVIVASNPIAEGDESILVVEDEELVRTLARRMLECQGYRVQAFASGDEAIDWCRAHNERIDLLLTDVILPGTNGRVLYGVLREIQPNLKVVYMSGYSGDVIAHHGVLEPGTAFIQKPFSAGSLISRIRATLDG